MWKGLSLFSPGIDDIFVTNSMWNGPYYWNREDLPEEWEQIFSFSQPESEHIQQLPEPENFLWFKDLVQNNDFLLYCSNTLIQSYY